MKRRKRSVCCIYLAILAVGISHSSRLGAAPEAAPRMWLELEPARYAPQATVVDILWLDGLDKQLSPSRPPGSAKYAALFTQNETVWQVTSRVEQLRPEDFQPPELRELVDLGGPARLFWRAAHADEPATLLQMIGDLEQVWGDGMQAAVADYSAAFDMLGRFHAATAEIREGQGQLTGRLVLVAASEAEAKRASGALALASTLGRMVSSGAVRSGQMSPEAGAALNDVLGSIETRVDGARLTVQLRIDVLTLRQALPRNRP